MTCLTWLCSARRFARGLGIKPTNRAVAATVDDIHPAAAGMLKDDDGSAREIELGDRRGDRKGFEVLCSFRNDDRVEAPDRFFVVFVWLLNKKVLSLAPRIRRGGGGMTLEPGLVAAQPTFDFVRRLIE